jgi:hypothetical protein
MGARERWEHHLGANLDRLAPLGEQAVSIIREAWEQRGESLHDQAEREHKESEPVDRVPTAGASITPGWAGCIELDQYWIRRGDHAPRSQGAADRRIAS